MKDKRALTQTGCGEISGNADFLFLGVFRPSTVMVLAYVTDGWHWATLSYWLLGFIRVALDRISVKYISNERSPREIVTVEVMGFPQDVTEDVIVDHFSYLYDLQPDFETKNLVIFVVKVHTVKNYLYGKEPPTCRVFVSDHKL